MPLGTLETRDEREAAAGRNTPVDASCPTCEHEWTVCYLPMPLETAAGLMMAAKCPKGCSAGPKVAGLVGRAKS